MLGRVAGLYVSRCRWYWWARLRMYTYVICSVESEECVGRQHLATGGEGMADLEQGVYREALVQLCSQSRERLVREKYTPLNLLGNLINRTRVAQSQCFSSLVKGVVCV